MPPFVMLSARAGEEAALEGLLMGADDYIVKPFSIEEFLARVYAQINAAAGSQTRDATNFVPARSVSERWRPRFPISFLKANTDGGVLFVSDELRRTRAVRPRPRTVRAGSARFTPTM